MKAERLSKQFEPIEIKITLETEEEAKTMYHLFNRHLFDEIDGDGIRDAISPDARIYNKEFHKALWKRIKENLNKKY